MAVESIESILDEWSNDAHVDKTRLDDFSIRIPALHAKYLRKYEYARASHENVKARLAQAQEDRRSWILGEMDDAEAKRRGWGACQTVLPLRSQAAEAAMKYPECAKLAIECAISDQRVDCLDKIIKTINGLSFSIRNAIEFIRFQSGLN